MAAEVQIANEKADSLDLRTVINSTPGLIHTGRPDGYLDFFNQPWLRYLGQPFENLQGWKWTAVIHPDDVEGILQKWRASLASGEPFLYEARVLRADGEYRWMLHHKVALRNQQAEIVKWYGSSIDIEDRKRAEEALQKSEFYLAEGQRLGHTGSWAFGPAGFDYWSAELFRMYGLAPASKAPTFPEYLDLIHPQDREFMASLIQRMLADASGCDVTKRILRPNGELRYIRCVGTPVVENGTLQRIVGTAMDVTDHELLTRELRRREAYLAEAQRLSHTGSFGWKPESGEIVWSAETYRIFDYDRALKPTIDSVLQRAHPEDRAKAKEVIDGASQTGTDFEHEYRLLMADGRVKHVHAIAHALHDSSGNIEFVGAVTDITKRKTAEEALRRSEAYLAEAQRLSHTGSFGCRLSTGEMFWSEETFRIYGYDRSTQPAVDRVLQRIHPEDKPSVQEHMDRASREGRSCDVECRLLFPDDSVKHVRIVAHASRNESGIIEFVGAVMDVTATKKAEEQIRDQEMELRQVLDLAPQLVGVFGPNSERIYANRVALDYAGLGLEEWRQTRGGLHSPGWFIHPDDRERAARAYSDGFRSGGSAYELEARVRKGDGSYRWFLLRCNPLRDDKGQIMRWYVAATDIEDRKRAEERLQETNVALREEIDKASMFEEIVGASIALQAVLSRIGKVSPTDSTVLITGETGTGKELVARAIHKRSHRSSGAFVSVNCAAIPRDLIASELFGHEKGAFTGATQRRLGRFELAEAGTLFLDEVGELPAETQIALLRVLQEREFERVGGGRPIPSDVRVIAATNRDLQADIAAGTFRSDLFYRLNVFPIEIPPLRERKNDIPLLVEYFVDRYARKIGKKIRQINKKTLDLLQSYPWPGNIRELQNVIERSVIVSEAETLSIDESWLSRQPTPSHPKSGLDLAEKLAAQEKEMIEAALRESGGRVYGPSGAAAKLGMPRSTLESKIRSLKIKKNRFKSVGLE